MAGIADCSVFVTVDRLKLSRVAQLAAVVSAVTSEYSNTVVVGVVIN